MDERLSDRICREAFTEYYLNQDYIEAVNVSKRVFRLLMRNENINSNDDYYTWMILMTIVKSYDNLNQIENSFKYILLSFRYANQEWMRIDSMSHLVKYYTKTNDNIKRDMYLRKCVESCKSMGNYEAIIRLIEYKFE